MNEKQKEKSIKALEKAIKLLGNSSYLASKLSVNRSAVSNWRSGREEVPVIHSLEIQALTHDAVTAYDLRPDIKAFENLTTKDAQTIRT